jgi:hypothetical protein
VAAVLLKVQATLFLSAGVIALPFSVAQPSIRAEALATITLAGGMYLADWWMRRERRWALTGIMVLEALSLVGSALLTLLPIGAIRGPVPMLTNLILPAAIFLFLLRHRRCRPHHAG